MITREEFYNAARKYFSFLVEKKGFLELERASQNTVLYDVEYSNKNLIISISYEVMGEGVIVIIFKVINGLRSEYDDYRNTIHLKRIMKSPLKTEIMKQLKSCRSSFEFLGKPETSYEKELLKEAILLSSVLRSISDDFE